MGVLVVTHHHLWLKPNVGLNSVSHRDRMGGVVWIHSINPLHHASSDHDIPWQSPRCLTKSFHPKQQGGRKQMGGVMGETALFNSVLQWRNDGGKRHHQLFIIYQQSWGSLLIKATDARWLLWIHLARKFKETCDKWVNTFDLIYKPTNCRKHSKQICLWSPAVHIYDINEMSKFVTLVTLQN